MEMINESIWVLILEIIVFLVLVAIGSFLYKMIDSNSNRLSNLGEALPEDEIHNLKQGFYLIMMALAFIDILYAFISTEGLIYFAVFDILLSLYLAITVDKSSLKGKIILLLLVPFDSLNFLMFNSLLVAFVDVIHILVFIYFIKLYYEKFRNYTESHGLSFTIAILFSIIFISFIVTQIVEGVNPLDSLAMVSNAFTSNGYAVLGRSIGGKINAIVLVWAGYILSSVGTATLTAAILIRHFNHKFEDVEKSNMELKESIRSLEESLNNDGTSSQSDDDES